MKKAIFTSRFSAGVAVITLFASSLCTSEALHQSTSNPDHSAGPGSSTNPLPPPSSPNPTLPSIFVAGDSTAARGAGERQQGWAVPFANFFDPAKVNIVNRARGGRSSRTFVSEGLWDQLLADAKSNDIVLIQFGQNDGGAVNDASRARGSLPGLGEETQEIDNLVTKKHEIVHTFGWYMRKMISDTKAKGAKPIVLNLTVRDVWTNGLVRRTPDRYNEWSEAIAKSARVPYIDLTDAVADQFDKIGEAKVKSLYYIQDFVHFDLAGAELHARCVLDGLKVLPDDPVAPYLMPSKP